MIINNKRDILGFSSSSQKVKTIAFRMVTVLQDYKPGDQVVSASVLWLMLCEKYQVNPSEMLGFAERLRNDTYDNKHDSQFRALEEYIEHELN